jgi:hypothetical protein
MTPQANKQLQKLAMIYAEFLAKSGTITPMVSNIRFLVLGPRTFIK